MTAFALLGNYAISNCMLYLMFGRISPFLVFNREAPTMVSEQFFSFDSFPSSRSLSSFRQEFPLVCLLGTSSLYIGGAALMWPLHSICIFWN